MDDWTAEEIDFRNEVRVFLDEKFTPALRAESAKQAGLFAEAPLAIRWQKILHERGWAAPAWPAEYGGPGWSARQLEIFNDECSRAGTPRLPGLGLRLCAPVIMKYGTAEQKAFFLPRMLSTEHYWCQGYSEPQAGSDLASLQTRADRDGDDYVVNGSKIWTTHAQYANWMFLLARTNQDVSKQKGISFLVTPLDIPGISIRPIISMSGEHEVNQVFLDNVRIPVANRMGDENHGWTVAKYLLEHERGGTSLAVRLRVAMDNALNIARTQPSDGSGTMMEDLQFRRKAALLEIEIRAAQALETRLRSGREVGESIGGAASSMKKLRGTEISQRIDSLAVEALGSYGYTDQRDGLGLGANVPPIGPDYALLPMARYLNNRASTIFAGSSEVQRNILARALLGK
jgi:alkylation response protein AidB-like acyl-CoA dehydrogenase